MTDILARNHNFRFHWLCYSTCDTFNSSGHTSEGKGAGEEVGNSGK